MKNSIIEQAIDKISGFFLNGIIVSLWLLSVGVLAQMDYPAAFQIWPVLLLLSMVALSLPVGLIIMFTGGITHSHRKTVF